MYLSLYRKYRPKRFEDVVGQDYIVTTLKNEIIKNRVGHAYLFTGVRGTGKTSCAKIFGKAINCENNTDGEACLKCEICQGIGQEKIYDIIEMDAASNNGVDNIRELKEESKYTPSRCKYRVYIIDEVHMMSTGAFNALLKIMEEPPKYVVFILATTEISKVPLTILSRCQRFDFKKIDIPDLCYVIEKVCKNESISIDDKAKRAISYIADGGVRDALSILERCISYSDKIDEKVVKDVYGISDDKYLNDILRSIFLKDINKGLKVVQDLVDNSKDLELFVKNIMDTLRNEILSKTKYSEELSNITSYEDDVINIMSNQEICDILEVLDMLQNVHDKMIKNSNKRLLFERFIIENGIIKKEISESTENVEIIDKLTKKILDLNNRISDLENKYNATPPKIELKEKALLSNEELNQDSNNVKEHNSIKDVKLIDKPISGSIDYLNDWNDIIFEAKNTDQVIYQIIKDTRAYEYEDKIFIESNNLMFMDLMKREGNAKKLINMLLKKKNKKYRIMAKYVKDVSNERLDNNKNYIEDILNKAQNMGIPIINKKEGF